KRDWSSDVCSSDLCSEYELAAATNGKAMLKFVVIAVVFLVGAWLQGAVGFGLGMIGAPVLALLRPDLLPATVILLAFFTSLFVLIREWTSVNWRYFGWVFLGRVPGTAFGAIAVSVFAPIY